MLDYLASRRVPLQLQLDSAFMFQQEVGIAGISTVASQDQERRHGSDQKDWWEGASPLNFLLNMDVALTIASGAKVVHRLEHLSALSQAISAAKRDLPQSLMLLAASFEHSFLPYHRRRELLHSFWARATGKQVFGASEGLTQRPIIGATRLKHMCNLASDPGPPIGHEFFQQLVGIEGTESISLSTLHRKLSDLGCSEREIESLCRSLEIDPDGMLKPESLRAAAPDFNMPVS
eukprot:COSAG02_NODE_1066_length_14828_cov_8.021794_8_plen_234_part_00